MKILRLIAIPTLSLALLGAGVVAAQPKDEHAAHHPDKAAPGASKGKAGGEGMGMMGGGMMGGMMCPGMMGAAAKLEVTKLAKGVTITITSDDPKVVARVQKMAEGMRLMHEANTP
jgi:hypothetical protein